MNQILKPCPFCGNSTPELVDNRVEWYVRCKNCKPYPTVIYGENVRFEVDEQGIDDSCIDWDRLKQTAVDAWNRRSFQNEAKEIT